MTIQVSGIRETSSDHYKYHLLQKKETKLFVSLTNNHDNHHHHHQQYISKSTKRKSKKKIQINVITRKRK